jgi:hypothetical protein
VFKRKLSFQQSQLPPKAKAQGNMLLLLDPALKRWCLVGRFHSKKHLRQKIFAIKQQAYKYGYVEVYHTR